MAALRFPPGRAGRTWLRERSAVAVSALSLLESKRALLEAESRRLRARQERTARDLELEERERDERVQTRRAGR
ncbi:hypothetical protein [Nocardia miyunensis]|uniref:hypothetical protein n=1 Tax=Nocardia miyunensis TaxID=282684 RepID=UPI000AD91D56|nr:hypothetical protein [Nocardia miyunensis]